ncbi:hypothetical protein [Cellulomonas sp. NPDC089187]|uniref:hypothetical protein n=1 Tax=Cellulomonas sp. NPDC089187 TaxID=3154970 RepID=UPI0034122A35
MQGHRRLARGFTAAAASTLIALLSHLIGGGAMPGPLGVLVPLLVATSAGVLLAGVRLPWLRLSGSVAVGQLGFHTLFVLGSAGSSSVVAATSHGHHPVLLVSGAGQSSAAGMWGAHAVAALVTVLMLRHGEQLLTRIAAVLRRVVVRLIRVVSTPLVAVVRARLSWSEPVVVRVTEVVRGGVVRRGPPARVGASC